MVEPKVQNVCTLYKCSCTKETLAEKQSEEVKAHLSSTKKEFPNLKVKRRQAWNRVELMWFLGCATGLTKTNLSPMLARYVVCVIWYLGPARHIWSVLYIFAKYNIILFGACFTYIFGLCYIYLVCVCYIYLVHATHINLVCAIYIWCNI